MKKILFALAMIFVSALSYAADSTAVAAVDSSCFFRQMNADGLHQLTRARKVQLTSQPGAWFIQAETGHTVGCYYQGWEIGLSAGVFYTHGQWSPAGELSVRNDAVYFWKKKAEVDGEEARVPVRMWAISGDLSMMPRWYTADAYSAGQAYFAYKLRANLELRLAQDPWSVFQLYLIGSAGYLFQKHDQKAVDIETEDTIDTYVVRHTGSGITFGGGLRAVFNFKHTPWSIQIKGMAENIPSVTLNRTWSDWQFSATIGVSYQLFARIK